MDPVAALPWRAAVVDLLRRTQLSQPDQLTTEVNQAVRPLGISMTIYLVDQEQKHLRPLPEPGKPLPAPLAIERTVAGRVFMAIRPSPGGAQAEPGFGGAEHRQRPPGGAQAEPGFGGAEHRQRPPGDAGNPERWWLPLVDGTERLGVVEVIVAEPEAAAVPGFLAECETFVSLLGHLVTVKAPYGDALVGARRSRRMSDGSELLWKLLPPLTFACERLVVSAVLEPCYDVGGDAFDYAVDGPRAYLAILDTVGHGLPAGLGTAVTLSAMRAARRDGDGLYAMARAADRAMIEQFSDSRFTTGVLCDLNLETGALRYLNAGHPAPMLLRHGKVIRRLGGGRRMPLGLDDPQIEIAEEVLEPGDRLLLFTDGVTEARDRAGQFFGESRLADLVARHGAARLPAPEMLRRLCHAALDHYDGPPRDDATLLLMEWSREAAERVAAP
jgi:sigma-B regulation protein RsbU (phosphoserine phosphatase)